jgi:EmrB/QacA subfamily drug resistance transporter
LGPAGGGAAGDGLEGDEVSEATGASVPGAANDGVAGMTGDGASGGATFLSHRQIMILLPGLLMTMLLAMLDQLVVGTALPRIVGDLGGATHLSWVVTAYVLASTITTPFYGKLGDMYGRKKLFIFAIAVFLAGSALSGLSSTMTELITFRAIQGLGAGGLIVGAMATLGETVPPRERGKYMSYFMVVMMVATVGGPLVGGWITTAISWRWIFYINLPLGGAALVYLIAVMNLPARRVEHKIDYLGGSLLGVVSTAVILLATWGGTQYQWGSWQIIALIALAVGGLAWFLRTERRAAEPMLPLHVFKIRNFSVTMVLTMFVGLALFGAMTFLPFYQQTVQGASPTVSGLLMTPLMVGSMLTSVLAGTLTSKTGKYRMFPIVGGLLMAVGMYLLSRIGVNTTRWTTGIDYVVLGLGMGCLMQMMSLIAQNSVELKDMGVATSARMFFQQIGGSLGVAAFGAIFAHKLTSSMSSLAAAGQVPIKGTSLDPSAVTSLQGPVKEAVLTGIAQAVHTVFLWAIPATVLVFLLALLIKEVPLRGRTTPGEEAPAPEAEALVG